MPHTGSTAGVPAGDWDSGCIEIDHTAPPRRVMKFVVSSRPGDPMANHVGTELLVIGAGPYGLAAATCARAHGIDVQVVGRPLEFWKRHMPRGMYLRSPAAWDFDTTGSLRFTSFLEERRVSVADADPIPLALFLEYGDWYLSRAALPLSDTCVRTLRRDPGGFVAVLDDGRLVRARHVVAAPGLRCFAHVPDTLARAVPPGRLSHTTDYVTFDVMAGRRVAIVGGRQSAFESAALLVEQGAREIHLVYRHDTPRFTASDWTFADGIIDATIATRGWFRRLPAAERDRLAHRFWAEGRLKLEPWLEPRLRKGSVALHPGTGVASCEATAADLGLRLTDGGEVSVDHVMAATGFKVDLRRVAFLTDPSIAPALATVDGYPVLDEDFQSSVPGLFLAGLVATRDFGPFFGFMRGAGAAARIIVSRIERG